jgi:hypothetical protein
MKKVVMIVSLILILMLGTVILMGASPEQVSSTQITTVLKANGSLNKVQDIIKKGIGQKAIGATIETPITVYPGSKLNEKCIIVKFLEIVKDDEFKVKVDAVIKTLAIYTKTDQNNLNGVQYIDLYRVPIPKSSKTSNLNNFWDRKYAPWYRFR